MFLDIFDDDSNTVFRDMIMLALCGILSIFVIILPFINEVNKKVDGDLKSPGDMNIEMFWADNQNIDLDLYVQSPDDAPVFYGRSNGVSLNLLRDDVGFANDISNKNYENVFARNVFTNQEYIINVSWFSGELHAVPDAKFYVIVTIRNKNGNRVQYRFDNVLKTVKEEITVIRFSINDEYKMDENSKHQTYISLKVN